MNVIKQFKSQSKFRFKTGKALSFIIAATLGVSLLGLQACGSSGGGGGGSTGPTLSVAAASVVEGNAGSANTVDFILTLSPAASSDVTVRYSTSDNTATGDVDYVSESSGTIVFPAGETSKTIPTVVTGDTDIELDESFNLLINSVDGAVIASGSQSVIGTILSDDSLAGYYTNLVDTKVNGPLGEITIPAGQIQVIVDVNRMAIIDLVNNLIYIVDISALNPPSLTATARVYKDGDFTSATNIAVTYGNVGSTGDLINITLIGPNGEDYSTTNGTMTLSYSAKNGDAPLVLTQAKQWNNVLAGGGFAVNSSSNIEIVTNGNVSSTILDSCAAPSVDLVSVKGARVRSFVAVLDGINCGVTTPLDGYITSYDTAGPDDTVLFVWFNDNGVHASALQ